MMTVLSGLEMEVEVSALGIGSEEGGVLLGGHIEVLIDLSTLSEFQFQYLLPRSLKAKAAPRSFISLSASKKACSEFR